MGQGIEKRIALCDQIILICFWLFALGCTISISLTQTAFAVATVTWLTRVFLKGSWEEIHTPLGVAFALFVLAALLSTMFSIKPSRSYYFVKKLVQIPIFFLFLNNLRSAARIKNLLYVIFIVSGLQGLYGLYQIHEAGLGLLTRAEGTMSVYVTFGSLMMLVSLMILSLLIFDVGWKKDWWMGGVLVLDMIAMALSLTRSAWVGFIAGLSVLLFFKNKRLVPFLPLAIFFVVAISPGPVRHRFQSIFDPSNPTIVSRIEMWRTGLNAFKDHPLTGTGFNMLPILFDAYKVKPDQKKVGGVHSNLFQIPMDFGLPGIFTWSLIWIAFFYRGRAIYRGVDAREAFARAVIVGSMAAVAAFLVTGCFEVNFYDSEVLMLIYFLMSLPFVLSLEVLGRVPGLSYQEAPPLASSR